MKAKAGTDTSFKAAGAKRKKAGGPKRGLTPFFAFLAEFRPQYLEKHPELKGVKEVTKAAGEKWRSMTDEEKAKYGGGKKPEAKASKPTNKKKVILRRFCELMGMCRYLVSGYLLCR
ncbi:hypothetical protein HU200_063110 [Digitaria exilis]|uniref:HMG box domain-containing protein n=1 Tax=Digitaria exilis TaxID=1010633 RepID=A0A835DWL9_9POAL|nr:hypothetical protein HU200_063110 [Digitaria exilis]